MPTSKCWMIYNTKAMKVNKITRSINPTLWWQPSREVAAAKVVEAEVVKAKVVVEKLVGEHFDLKYKTS